MTSLPRSKRSVFLLWNKIFLLILFACSNPVYAQLAAYHDNQGRFYIFDNGKTIEAEYLPVKEFSVGGRCILYTDNRSRLKMYYKGIVTTLSVNAPDHFAALDYLAVYSTGGVVSIIDNGHNFTVSTNSLMYNAQDSLVTFYDASQELLAVYYKGRIQMLEDGLAGKIASQFKSGDNLVAYISSRTLDFKIFYLGQTRVIEPFLSGGSFQTGRDIVAYVNQADMKFRMFYKGDVYLAEEFPPESWQVGDGIAAYVDNTGSFKVFCDGEVINIGSFKPDFYMVQNRMIIYGEKGYFKAWYNYRSYTLETFIPNTKDWIADWNTVVYIDLNRNVKIFNQGENKVLTYDLAEEIALYRDIVVVNKGMNNHNVYYKGKKY
jgi:hypothetical protein